jgi:hypothetical protein
VPPKVMVPARGASHAHDRLERRGLSSTVASEQRDRFAGFHAERNALQRVAETVEGIDAVDIELGGTPRRPPTPLLTRRCHAVGRPTPLGRSTE